MRGLHDGVDDAPCTCGSKNCRGSMYSPAELRKQRRAEAREKKAEIASKKKTTTPLTKNTSRKKKPRKTGRSV